MRLKHLTRSWIRRARRQILRKPAICEPPMCCPAGVCGPAPDPALAKLQENILRGKRAGLGGETANMVSVTGMMTGRKGGGCCG